MITQSCIAELRCNYCGLIHKLKITTRVDFSSVKELRVLLPLIEILEGDCIVLSRTDEAVQ